MTDKKNRLYFERVMLRYLDASYNLALWLLKNPSDAEDVVQIAYMKAFEHFSSFTESNARGWILTIVRNTAYNWLNKQKQGSNLISFEEALHSTENCTITALNAMNPEEITLTERSSSQMLQYIESLPTHFRETLYLREIEGYSYKEISTITQVSKGTVMSRLSRAREQLRKMIIDQKHRKKIGEL